MKLKLLDIRANRLTQIMQSEASTFLEETVVLMWDNPFECDTSQLLKQASKILVGLSDVDVVPNPLHLFTERKDIGDI